MDTGTVEDLPEYVGGACDWYDLPCNLSSFSSWLGDFLLFVPRKAWQLLLEGLAATIAAIPVPDFFADADTYLSNIPGSVTWLLEYCAIEQGIGIVLAAYVIRFTIRRLPVVG